MAPPLPHRTSLLKENIEDIWPENASGLFHCCIFPMVEGGVWLHAFIVRKGVGLQSYEAVSFLSFTNRRLLTSLKMSFILNKDPELLKQTAPEEQCQVPHRQQEIFGKSLFNNW